MKLVPAVEIHGDEARRIAQRHVDDGLHDLGPLRLVSRQRAGDAAVDDALLERRDDFAEGNGHRRTAQRLDQVGL
jgi:hypothetical protein